MLIYQNSVEMVWRAGFGAQAGYFDLEHGIDYAGHFPDIPLALFNGTEDEKHFTFPGSAKVLEYAEYGTRFRFTFRLEELPKEAEK